MKGRHLVDVTEIYNQLSWEKKQRFFKIGYLLILFILSLFWYCDKNVFIDARKLLALFEALSYMFLLCKCDLGCFGALETNMINHAPLLSLSSPIVSLLIQTMSLFFVSWHVKASSDVSIASLSYLLIYFIHFTKTCLEVPF